jgi:uncharacterized protein
VKVPDTNVLLAAVNADAPGHAGARDWLADALSGSEPIGFAWLVLVGFVRIATKASIFARPLSPGEALNLVDEWLARPNATVLNPGERHAGILRSLLEQVGTGGNLTSDAHVAALAIEHRASVATFDANFHRFGELRLDFLRP